MAHFTIDVVADILSRLPVEPILRFRCVSKPWCALIDSPHFIKLHLKRSIDTSTNRQLILSTNSVGELYSVNMHSLDVAVKIDHHPFLKEPGEYFFLPQVVGSCHGLVLLRSRRDNLAVWNPSTRIYHILPPHITTDDDIQTPEGTNSYGIGFDSVHDDYKVLNIIPFHDEKGATFRTGVQVYSLKTNSWRKIITEFPYYLYYEGCNGMLASGALHWIASETDYVDDDNYFIVAFNLATEEYRILLIPNIDHKESVDFHMELASFDGCLCILSDYADDPCSVWIMKDYGVEESWTKLLSDHPPIDVPVAFSKDGTKILFLQDSTDLLSTELIWYDLRHKVVQKVNIRGLPPHYSAEIMVQSLVPLNVVVGSNVKELHREGNTNKIEKKSIEVNSCMQSLVPNIYWAEFCMQSLVPLGRDDSSIGMKQHKEEHKDKRPKGNDKKRGGILLEGSSSRSRQVKKEL